MEFLTYQPSLEKNEKIKDYLLGMVLGTEPGTSGTPGQHPTNKLLLQPSHIPVINSGVKIYSVINKSYLINNQAKAKDKYLLYSFSQ